MYKKIITAANGTKTASKNKISRKKNHESRIDYETLPEYCNKTPLFNKAKEDI